jgi:hypothetical protein
VTFSFSAIYENRSSTPIYLLGGDLPYYDFEHLGADSAWHRLGIVWTGTGGDVPRQEVRPGTAVRMEWSPDTGLPLTLADGSRFGGYGFWGQFRILVVPSFNPSGPAATDIPEFARASRPFHLREVQFSWPQVQEHLMADVDVLTEKSIYTPGDDIALTLTNNHDHVVFFPNMCSARIEEFTGVIWRPALLTEPPRQNPDLLPSCYRDLILLSPSESKVDYKHLWLPVERATKYRVRSYVQFEIGADAQEYSIVSNDFEIGPD